LALTVGMPGGDMSTHKGKLTREAKRRKRGVKGSDQNSGGRGAGKHSPTADSGSMKEGMVLVDPAASQVAP